MLVDQPLAIRPPRSLALRWVVTVALAAIPTLAVAGGDRPEFVIRSGSAELSTLVPVLPGKVPVVFLHGFLGSPAQWSVMIDRLSAMPELRDDFQFFTFRYDTLQTLDQSARQLLASLVEARRRRDPEGRDTSFDQVILVGHSMGGLVAKAAAVAEIDAPAGRSTPPHVGRLVFVATPHRGVLVDPRPMHSAGLLLSRATRAIRPGARTPVSVSTTSLDEMAWDSPLIRALERGRVWSGTPSHSIVVSLGDPNAEGATDGIVPVASARIVGTRSELLIRGDHACLQRLDVCGEVGRILSERLREPGGPRPLESKDARRLARPAD